MAPLIFGNSHISSLAATQSLQAFAAVRAQRPRGGERGARRRPDRARFPAHVGYMGGFHLHGLNSLKIYIYIYVYFFIYKIDRYIYIYIYADK